MRRIQKRLYSLTLALAMVLILAAPAHAATYDYAVEGGNLKFDPATGAITGCDKSVYSANIPSEIYGVPVTVIGAGAFYQCSKLSSVVIPSTVTKIERGAFAYCSQLTSILIPNSVTTLENGHYKTTVSALFAYCKKLESITIPGSVKTLPDGIFRQCENLKNVTLEYGIEEISPNAFVNCKSLESITLPDSVKNIGTNAFKDCTSLTTVTLGNGLKNIENNVFYNTSSLSSLYFRGSAPSATDKMIGGSKKFADGFMIYYPEGASGWTTPTWNGYITKAYTLPGSAPAQTQTTTPATPAPAQPASNMVTAVPSYSPVYVNGTQVKFDAYNIDKNNYFKLRDLAFILSGTRVQFNVEWKNAVAMTSGQPYTPVGGEMAAGSGLNQIAKPTTSSVLLDGSPVNLTAYNINGNNYFKLRDIGNLFDFGVRYDSALQGVVIETDESYVDV